jgi:transposase
MTPTEIRNAVCTLQAKGHSLREISRSLALSRNTVRRILRQPNRAADEAAPCDEATLARLKAAFERARGNVVRVQELLADDGLEVRYSTLTRWAREAGLRSPPRRAGEYDFAPGQEMQHDTSPHRVLFAKAGTPGKIVTVQCAGLVLAYSRRLFMQYYPRFTRFEAKTFLLEAVRFMDGVCPICVIDNTSVLLAAGAGGDAVIAPEMLAFARTLGDILAVLDAERFQHCFAAWVAAVTALTEGVVAIDGKTSRRSGSKVKGKTVHVGPPSPPIGVSWWVRSRWRRNPTKSSPF